MLGLTKELYVMLPNFKLTHLSRKQTILLFKKVACFNTSYLYDILTK